MIGRFQVRVVVNLRKGICTMPMVGKVHSAEPVYIAITVFLKSYENSICLRQWF